MRTVWKYPLPDEATQWVLNLPPSATVVAVGHQNRIPTLWIYEIATEETL